MNTALTIQEENKRVDGELVAAQELLSMAIERVARASKFAPALFGTAAAVANDIGAARAKICEMRVDILHDDGSPI